eukprot:6176267-Prorocentrum_lima.AAC.1
MPLAVAVHPIGFVHWLEQKWHEVAQLREGVVNHPRECLATHGAKSISGIKGHHNSGAALDIHPGLQHL